jgi:hypothetical protein
MNREDVIQLLGTQQQDKVTGFTGMVSSISFDAYGCIQAVLTPKVGKDHGVKPESHWFDVNRLEPKGKRVLPSPSFAAYGIDKGPAEKPALTR